MKKKYKEKNVEKVKEKYRKNMYIFFKYRKI